MSLHRSLMALLSVCLFGCNPAEPPQGTSSEGTPASTAGTAADTWQSLFDGSNLDRWNVLGDANWEIVDDTVRADTGNGFLVSDVDYANFDLMLEFWVDVEANSGVFIRCASADTIGADSCYEVNIFDTRPDQTYRTGGIVNHATPSSIVYTGGRWNSYEISADGPRLQVTLNGMLVVDVEDSTYSRGPIALQYGAGTVIFRNVKIRTR